MNIMRRLKLEISQQAERIAALEAENATLRARLREYEDPAPAHAEKADPGPKKPRVRK